MHDSDTASISIGLDAIFSLSEESIENTKSQNINGKELRNIAVDLIDPSPYQARKVFTEDELRDLAASIKSLGILQPLTARKVNNRYELIAGERRLRAAKLAGLKHVPLICCDITNEASMAFGLIENLQREDLNIIDEAHAYKRLLSDFGLTHEKVSEVIGKSRSSISNSLRLLGLSDDVQRLLIEKKLEMGHARALLNIPKKDQGKIAFHINKNKFTVRQTENYIKRLLNQENKLLIEAEFEINTLEEEKKLHDLLGVETNVIFRKKGSGVISIPFSSVEDFKQLIKIIELNLTAGEL